MLRRMNTLVYNEIMILLRDSTTLFWILIFPLFFLFMMLFSYGTDGQLPVQTIEIADLDKTPSSARYIALVADTFTSKSAIPGVLKRVADTAPIGAQAVRITIPEGFGYAVERRRSVDVNLTFQQDGMPAQFAVRVVRALSVRFNNESAGTPEMVEVQVDERGAAPALGFAQYTLTGILVMSMMSAGMSTICVALAYRRERNGFKMMACLPVSPTSFLMSMLLSRLIVLLLASGALLLSAHFLFGIRVPPDPRSLAQGAVVMLLGGAMLLALGTAMAARMATVSAATLATNLVYIALLFLSDLTMPLTAMPPAVGAVMAHLPTAEFVSALRQVLIRGDGLAQQVKPLAAMLAWTLLFAFIARVSFRWHRQAGG